MSTAAPSPPADVFDVLSRSRARLHRRATLGDGLAVAQWSNSFDATRYLPRHHTLSLYLRGGHGTYREDAPTERGAPGKLCLMPAGHEVNWVVGSEQTFVHLYFEAERLAPLALRLLDREPRELRLPELNFCDDPELVASLARLVSLDWTDAGERLAANALGHAALAHVLARHAGRAPRGDIRGGLAPALRRRLVDWLDARLAQAVTVGEMAAFCALSETHFAHAFRASMGVAPHEWIVARRIERAAALLRARHAPSLDDVARATGHASASHLVRRFKAVWGMTPGQYRAAAGQLRR
ncbi:AraC family transcriptional regulator [Scleromatobacter humisilvae]|uniref:AraC family transcriptional regulator n=1 Tax=Scleromatobacter humisilvae TaxID=2897159 RepID=A0A9X1YEQ8_9BURK|nr:AraC family transcriptional regulator [Scleromatobacter humisilvae]MCK9684653.1 AraC family transcriptional regulator [Scleromatobacter humisilvae]